MVSHEAHQTHLILIADPEVVVGVLYIGLKEAVAFDQHGGEIGYLVHPERPLLQELVGSLVVDEQSPPARRDRDKRRKDVSGLRQKAYL